MEAGKEFAWYFDPNNYNSFEEKLSTILNNNCKTNPEWSEMLKLHLLQSSWEKYADQVFSICNDI